MTAESSAGAKVSRWALWFGLWGGGVAWLLHLLLVYGIAEFGCLSGLGQVRAAGITVVAWLLIGASVLTLLIAGAALLVALRSRDRANAAGQTAPGDDAELFVGRAGWIATALFLAIILIQSIPIFFFLKDC
jgi:heme/copper-type cytochrome/quinol oxidase subunit 2